jgi:hypothetical protein
VDGAKYAAEQFFVAWLQLELNHVLIESIQVLIALDEKLSNDILLFRHV